MIMMIQDNDDWRHKFFIKMMIQDYEDDDKSFNWSKVSFRFFASLSTFSTPVGLCLFFINIVKTISTSSFINIISKAPIGALVITKLTMHH